MFNSAEVLTWYPKIYAGNHIPTTTLVVQAWYVGQGQIYTVIPTHRPI